MNSSQTENNITFSDDEIDVRELFKVIWNDKKIVIAITSFFSLAAVIYSLLLPNIYESKALLSPVGEQVSSNQSMKNLGGLASLAGIDISNQGGGNSAKAIEKLGTLSFFQENILPNIFLPDLMASIDWDEESNKVIYKEDLFNTQAQKWSRIPSSQTSFKEFLEVMEVTQDKTTGFVKISFKHYSPYVAKEWTELVVDQINDSFRTLDKLEAQASMDYLNAQMAQTSYSEIKEVIAQILKQKMQQLSLIEANEFYVFSYLDSPAVEEEKIEPTRSKISIFGAVFGLLLGIIIVIVRDYLNLNARKTK